MDSLTHRIKVFVFAERGGDLQYLMVRRTPRPEPIWGPIEGPILPSENLELAVCRRVRDEVGIEKPRTLLDLRMPERWALPDENVVEWIYGYGVDANCEVRRAKARGQEVRWEAFDHAFASMELPGNRDAILRLHLTLSK